MAPVIEVKLLSHQLMNSSRGRNGTGNSQGNPEDGGNGFRRNVGSHREVQCHPRSSD